MGDQKVGFSFQTISEQTPAPAVQLPKTAEPARRVDEVSKPLQPSQVRPVGDRLSEEGFLDSAGLNHPTGSRSRNALVLSLQRLTGNLYAQATLQPVKASRPGPIQAANPRKSRRSDGRSASAQGQSYQAPRDIFTGKSYNLNSKEGVLELATDWGSHLITEWLKYTGDPFERMAAGRAAFIYWDHYLPLIRQMAETQDPVYVSRQVLSYVNQSIEQGMAEETARKLIDPEEYRQFFPQYHYKKYHDAAEKLRAEGMEEFEYWEQRKREVVGNEDEFIEFAEYQHYEQLAAGLVEAEGQKVLRGEWSPLSFEDQLLFLRIDARQTAREAGMKEYSAYVKMMQEKLKTWEEATRTGFRPELEKLAKQFEQDLVAYDTYANRMRSDAARQVHGVDIFSAWEVADRAVTAIKASVIAGKVDTAVGYRFKESVTYFYRVFRSRVAVSDYYYPDSKVVAGNRYFFTQAEMDWRFFHLEGTDTPAEWRIAITHFKEVTGMMDAFLIEGLKAIGKTKEAEQLPIAGGVSIYLDDLYMRHPDTKKVRAVFYPRERIENVGKPGEPSFGAYAIPLLLYIYRDEDTWSLVELTTPAQRKVNKEAGGTETMPPLDLFKELNSALRFPKGMLYWEMPDGSTWSLKTTAEKRLSDWLAWTGIAAAVIGLAVFTVGASVAATVFFITSGVLTAASAAADIAEKSQHDLLTAKDIVVDVATIVSSMGSAATAGFGKVIVTGVVKTGNFARVAILADKIYRPVLLTTVGADAVTLLVASQDVWDEYDAIDKSEGTDADKRLAKERLMARFLLTAGIQLLAMKGDIADFRRSPHLYLDEDFLIDKSARYLFTEKQLFERIGKMSQPEDLELLLKRKDIPEDLFYRIQADFSYAAATKKIPMENLQGIISGLRAAKTTDKIHQVLAELRHANRLTYTKAADPFSTIVIGARKETGPIKLKEGVEVKIDPVHQADALYLGADGKIHMDEVKNTAQAFRQKLNEHPRQLINMKIWQSQQGAVGREIQVVIETDEGWTELFGLDRSKEQRSALMALLQEKVPLQIGPYRFNVEKMQLLWNATEKKARSMGMYPPKEDFFRNMPTLKDAESFLGISLR